LSQQVQIPKSCVHKFLMSKLHTKKLNPLLTP
jgi:hypothetical protein